MQNKKRNIEEEIIMKRGKIQKPSEFEMDEQGLKKLAVLLRELRGTKS